jgi:hypothetical protein
VSPTGVPANGTRAVRTCSQCGGTGHTRKTCPNAAGVTESGAKLRKLAPGVSGEDLAALDPIIVRGGQRVPITIDLRVVISVEVNR